VRRTSSAAFGRFPQHPDEHRGSAPGPPRSRSGVRRRCGSGYPKNSPIRSASSRSGSISKWGAPRGGAGPRHRDVDGVRARRAPGSRGERQHPGAARVHRWLGPRCRVTAYPPVITSTLLEDSRPPIDVTQPSQARPSNRAPCASAVSSTRATFAPVASAVAHSYRPLPVKLGPGDGDCIHRASAGLRRVG
jgi:hypothetical protein